MRGWGDGSSKRDRATLMVIVLLVALAIVWSVALGVIYWGDEYATPAWDESGVPAPKLY